MVGRMSTWASSVMQIGRAAGAGRGATARSMQLHEWTTMSSAVLHFVRDDFGCYSLVSQIDETLTNCCSAAEALTLITDSGRVRSLADSLARLAQEWTNEANARASAVFELLSADGLVASCGSAR